ncbi:MAG: FoF1 ATP synthase subunit gamma, partial [Candidatus Latescibacteria bacterium]|nr:FoF1 ATP synthase subunit gamma [Candidatus Latescibacterota bacterium]
TDHADVFRQLEFASAVSIAQQLTDDFVQGRVDKVLLVYSQFRSVALQEPAVHQLLPIVSNEDEASVEGNYIFEPDPDQLLDILVPRHVNFQVWRALLESNAGFFAAQMTSMDNATKNAGDLIDELTREMNKERQSSITLELMDIIGGAEAVG